MDKHYGVVVVGSGPAGVEAALAARRAGSSVLLVDRGPFGGTCLNEGCVPSGALLENIERGTGTPDERLRAARSIADRLITALGKGLRASVVAAGVELHSGEVAAVDGGEVTFTGGESPVRADAVVLAIGATSVRPPLPGAENAASATWVECLDLTRAPRSVVVVAGGPLALEAVRFFRGLDATVTLLPGEALGIVSDPELTEFLYGELDRRGVMVRAATVVTAVNSAGDSAATVRLADGVAIDCDLVVFADFRAPRTSPLTAALRRGVDGFVDADHNGATSVSGVYACGDMAGAPLLASVAKRQGALAGAAAASAPGYMAQPPIAVHASPEVASVGLSETEARKAYEQVSVGYAEYSASARAFALGSEQGVVKLVVDADSGEILGGHIIGAGATELISAVALAMAAEATVDTLAVAVHAHPSVAELISEAARQALLPS